MNRGVFFFFFFFFRPLARPGEVSIWDFVLDDLGFFSSPNFLTRPFS